MKISEVFPRKYATGADLKGQVLTLTIARVVLEEMHPQPGAPAEKKPVIYFESAQKGIILSPALARQIADILGDETNEWKGKKITIYLQPMTVAGKERVAIRARRATNGSTPPPDTLQDPDEEEE